MNPEGFAVARSSWQKKPGFSIVEIVTALAIIAVLTGILLANINPETPNDRARYDAAADALRQLANAIAANEATKPPRSFHQVVGVYPEKLSHLTTPITTADKNLCGDAYTGPVGTAGTNTYKWQKAANAFWGRDLLTSGTPLVRGFTVQNAIVRKFAVQTGAGSTANVMQLVMPSVTLTDAQGLDVAIDGVADGTKGTVLYATPSPTTNPTSVSYSINFNAKNAFPVVFC